MVATAALTVQHVVAASFVGTHAGHFVIAALVFAGFGGAAHLGARRDRRRQEAADADFDRRFAAVQASLRGDGGVASTLPDPPVDHQTPQPSAVRWAAAASLAAGVVHIAVCPEHFREATAFGVFFVVAAAVQIVWATRVTRTPTTAWLSAGIALSVVLVATWAASRTVGLPVGPGRWTPEAVTGEDVLATALELVTIAGCLAAVRWRQDEGRARSL